MSLRKSTGNMYQFVTHTWNPIKGKCYHDCEYCYMKRFPLPELRIDDKELRVNLGRDNFIFVGSGTDVFSEAVPYGWIESVLTKCREHDNKYLFQTKNPAGFAFHRDTLPDESILCITLETNRHYIEMGKAPHPNKRISDFNSIIDVRKMITIEPIMDFDLDAFLSMLLRVNPIQINIGADSGRNNLPEPTDQKIEQLVQGLESSGINVHLKSNLKRLWEGAS